MILFFLTPELCCCQYNDCSFATAPVKQSVQASYRGFGWTTTEQVCILGMRLALVILYSSKLLVIQMFHGLGSNNLLQFMKRAHIIFVVFTYLTLTAKFMLAQFCNVP